MERVRIGAATSRPRESERQGLERASAGERGRRPLAWRGSGGRESVADDLIGQEQSSGRQPDGKQPGNTRSASARNPLLEHGSCPPKRPRLVPASEAQQVRPAPALPSGSLSCRTGRQSSRPVAHSRAKSEAGSVAITAAGSLLSCLPPRSPHFRSSGIAGASARSSDESPSPEPIRRHRSGSACRNRRRRCQRRFASQ